MSRDDAGRHDPAGTHHQCRPAHTLSINHHRVIGNLTGEVFHALAVQPAAFPFPFTRMSGTSFSSSSRAPCGKNSAELTGRVRFHCISSKDTWRTDRPRPTSPRRRPTSYNRCYDNGLAIASACGSNFCFAFSRFAGRILVGEADRNWRIRYCATARGKTASTAAYIHIPRHFRRIEYYVAACASGESHFW